MSAFYFAVTAQKSKNILHKFIPIQFVVQFMPRLDVYKRQHDELLKTCETYREINRVQTPQSQGKEVQA